MLTFITAREHDVVDIRTLSDTAELLSFLDTLSEVCIDIETNSLDPLVAQIFLVSIGNEERQYVIDATSIPLDFLNNYKHLLYIGHNIKYDYTVLKQNGINLVNLYDTMIVEQRLGMGSGRKNSLDVVILRRLGIKTKMNKEETRSSFKTGLDKYNTGQVIYSGEDVEHLIKIKNIQKPLIERYQMEFLIYEIEMPLISILGDCELTGLVIDRDKWIEIIKEKEQEEQDLNKQLYEILKSNSDISGLYGALWGIFHNSIRKKSLGLWSQRLRINFNSSTQLKSIFTLFGEPLPKGTRKSKTGEFEEIETVGIKNLQLYIKQRPETILKEFIEVFIKYKKTQKHLSSFGYSYLDMISSVTGLLHTAYKQCFTDTGRLSSGDSKTGKVNIQQVPKLKKLRKCFKYLAGYKILTIDLAQAELVFLSSKAQDKKLMELNNGDIHSYLATKAWRKILNDETYVVSQEVNTDKRTEFKNVVYGAVYGAGIQKIAETMNISLEQAVLVMQSLREELPDTFKYMDNASKFAVDNGYIEFSKRTHSRRWFPDRSRKFIGKVKRAAINAPLQGECADAIKESMVEVSKYIKRNNTDAKLLLQAHDELVYAFKDEDFPEVVKYIMTSTVNKYLEGVEMNATYHVEETWIK